jgi:hypothetical protein
MLELTILLLNLLCAGLTVVHHPAQICGYGFQRIVLLLVVVSRRLA